MPDGISSVPADRPRESAGPELQSLETEEIRGAPSVKSTQRDPIAAASAVAVRDSFTLFDSDQVIESVVMLDGRSVRDFLGEGHPAGQIARLAGEGIGREGIRCLEGGSEGAEGQLLCDELIECNTIESLLRTCASFYTRETFLYRRINKFLRLGPESDRETGRNLGLCIGLLRECFCVRGELNPVSWSCPKVVYRGASFSIDIVVDYARCPEELIRWQGFTSSSGDQRTALGFPGNVLFQISVTHSLASLDDISAFKTEHEFILTPYQWFSLNDVRWDGECQRWILSVAEDPGLPAAESWFPEVGASSVPPVPSA
jgi:hypothetical protein